MPRQKTQASRVVKVVKPNTSRTVCIHMVHNTGYARHIGAHQT
jgi:hypothetical protein